MAKPQPTDRDLVNRKSLRDLTAMLVKDAGLHEGLFDISFEIQIAIGTMGPTPTDVLPGAMFGVKAIGLLPSKTRTPVTVDAAEVNPSPAAARKVATKVRTSE